MKLPKDGTAYQLIANKLKEYGLDPKPILCGYGVEVYQNDTVRMVVDLNSYTLNIEPLNGGF